MIELSSGKRDLRLETPWVNVPGMAGFSDEIRSRVAPNLLAARFTNPVSRSPRTASRPPRVLAYPGGFLLHTGHPNPGLRRVIASHRARWRSMASPVLLTLLAQDAEELGAMAGEIEPVAEIAGVAVLLDGSNQGDLADWLAAAALAQRPVVAVLPLDVSAQVVNQAERGGAQAIFLGPARGSLPSPAGPVSGRLFGPAVFPLALQAATRLAPEVSPPLIVSGGVGTREQATALLEAGAAAVGLDYILWRDPPAMAGADAEG